MAAEPGALLVSVVICTHNRATWLERALASVVEQLPEVPSEAPAEAPAEVIVVDNRSTDSTPEVAARYAGDPRVRYVFEDRLGLCHARNSGWQRARGRYIAYLDDDAVVEPGWLAAIPAAFARCPQAGVVGGRVTPIWGAARPAWLSDDVSLSLTIADWAPEPKVIEDLRREWLVGANFAVPAAVLAEVGGFRTELGRVGRRLLSGEEMYLQRQVVRRGYVCLYEPAMAVRHLVPASRLDKRWFRRRYYWQGVSDALMELLDDRPTWRRRAAAAIEHVRRLAREPRRLGGLIVPTDDPARFTQQCFTWIAVGHVAGLLGAARR